MVEKPEVEQPLQKQALPSKDKKLTAVSTPKESTSACQLIIEDEKMAAPKKPRAAEPKV